MEEVAEVVTVRLIMEPTKELIKVKRKRKATVKVKKERAITKKQLARKYYESLKVLRAGIRLEAIKLLSKDIKTISWVTDKGIGYHLTGKVDTIQKHLIRKYLKCSKCEYKLQCALLASDDHEKRFTFSMPWWIINKEKVIDHYSNCYVCQKYTKERSNRLYNTYTKTYGWENNKDLNKITLASVLEEWNRELEVLNK